MNFSFVRKAEKMAVGASNKEVCNKVLFASFHSLTALAAPFLASIEVNGVSLDVPGVGDGNHHLFVFDQVFVAELFGLSNNFCSTGIPKLGFNFFELLSNDIKNEFFATKNFFKFFNKGHNLFELSNDLVPLETR